MAIPPQILPSVMRELARAGLVEAQSGRAGGYRWRMPAASISLLTVIEAIEGERGAGPACCAGGPCGRDGNCAVHGAFYRRRSPPLRTRPGDARRLVATWSPTGGRPGCRRAPPARSRGAAPGKTGRMAHCSGPPWSESCTPDWYEFLERVERTDRTRDTEGHLRMTPKLRLITLGFVAAVDGRMRERPRPGWTFATRPNAAAVGRPGGGAAASTGGTAGGSKPDPRRRHRCPWQATAHPRHLPRAVAPTRTHPRTRCSTRSRRPSCPARSTTSTSRSSTR